jgi:hypothetical protein
MALVSIAEDNGDFAASLHHAGEQLTLGPGNAQLRLWSRNSKRRRALKPGNAILLGSRFRLAHESAPGAPLWEPGEGSSL